MDVDERRDRVAKLTAAGETAEAIAQQLKISSRTVCRDRAALGISQSGGQPFTAREALRAKEFLDDGASYTDVAKTLGRCPKTIQVHLPGYEISKQEKARRAAMGRQFAKLMRKHHP